MKKLFTTTFLCLFLTTVFAQTTLLSTSFEGPGFDEGWTMGMSQGIDLEPQNYPASGLDPWEKWDITEATSFGYVHSGDSAAWIGGTAFQEPKHDWLMTPVISIPEDCDAFINYWLWYHSEAAYVNTFYIMIYDIENSTWHESYKLANEFNSPYHYTEPYKHDISAWQGKDIKIAFVKNGTYQMAMDDISVVYYASNSIDETSQQQISLFPNPTSDVLNVKLETMPENNLLTINDFTGRIVYETKVTDNNTQINISDLSSGIYFINIGNYRTKIVVR